jgi:hypothetical protein
MEPLHTRRQETPVGRYFEGHLFGRQGWRLPSKLKMGPVNFSETGLLGKWVGDVEGPRNNGPWRIYVEIP